MTDIFGLYIFSGVKIYIGWFVRSVGIGGGGLYIFIIFYLFVVMFGIGWIVRNML